MDLGANAVFISFSNIENGQLGHCANLTILIQKFYCYGRMEDIEAFVDGLESGNLTLLDEKVRINTKNILFSIFKLIVPELKNQVFVDEILNKFDYDQISFWSSLEVVMKPEIKRLYENIKKISSYIREDIAGDFSSTYLEQKNTILDLFFNKQKIDLIKNLSEGKLSLRNVDKEDKTMLKRVSEHREESEESVDLFNYDEMMKFVNEDIDKFENTSFESFDLEENNFGLDDVENFKYDDFFTRNTNSKLSNDGEEMNSSDIDITNISETSTVESDTEEHSIYAHENSFAGHGKHLDSKYFISNLKNSTELASDNLNSNGESHSNCLSNIEKEQKKMNIIIDELEAEIIREKEWYKSGESSATKRDKNSLLSLHLEVPQLSSTNHDNEIFGTEPLKTNDISNEESDFDKVNSYLETIIKQRIIDGLFDDVEPKNSVFKMFYNQNEQPIDEIQVEKSKLSLAEIYSKKYEQQVLGNNTNEELSKEKKSLAELFSLLMQKLDSLSNQYFVPNLHVYNESIANDDVPVLKVEDTVPIIVSDSSRLAPHELKKRTSFISRMEMSREERKSDRNMKKRKFSNMNVKKNRVSLEASSKVKKFEVKAEEKKQNNLNNLSSKRIKLH